MDRRRKIAQLEVRATAVLTAALLTAGVLAVVGPAGAAAGGQTPRVNDGECFLLSRADGAGLQVLGGGECDVRTAPASTFKIPHALIALQEGVITPATLIKWDGTKYGFRSWRRDHTLESALRSSVYPFFQRTAAAIGRERMIARLRELPYGSDSFDGELTTFWTNGDLEISPREQLTFLQRMFTGGLPIDRAHVEVVKRALAMPRGRISNAAGMHPFPLRWPAGTVVRAKTGNANVRGERISWLVGELESNGRAYVFAARVRSATRPLDTVAGAAVARRGLNAFVPPR